MLFFAVSLPSLAVAHAETSCATQNEERVRLGAL